MRVYVCVEECVRLCVCVCVCGTNKQKPTTQGFSSIIAFPYIDRVYTTDFICRKGRLEAKSMFSSHPQTGTKQQPQHISSTDKLPDQKNTSSLHKHTPCAAHCVRGCVNTSSTVRSSERVFRSKVTLERQGFEVPQPLPLSLHMVENV